MAFKMRKGPLPPNHPLKGGCVIFGMKRPGTPSTSDQDETTKHPVNKAVDSAQPEYQEGDDVLDKEGRG